MQLGKYNVYMGLTRAYSIIAVRSICTYHIATWNPGVSPLLQLQRACWQRKKLDNTLNQHLEIVLKWLFYGFLCCGLQDNMGPYVDFPALWEGQLPCTVLCSGFFGSFLAEPVVRSFPPQCRQIVTRNLRKHVAVARILKGSANQQQNHPPQGMEPHQYGLKGQHKHKHLSNHGFWDREIPLLIGLEPESEILVFIIEA